MDTALSIIPKLLVSDEGGYFLRQGQPVLVPNAPRNGMVRLVFKNDEFFGLGEVLEDGRIAPRKIVVDTSSTKASAILRG
jgi:tRNA pseudouridine55 synthase